LGLESTYDYTPQVYRRIVFAAAQGKSFADAAEALSELGELQLLPKRIWRAAKRVGAERVAECRAAAARYEALPLPAQCQSPVDQTPAVVCVQMDGGRFQARSRVVDETPTPPAGAAPADPPPASADSSAREHWREYKAGVLLRLHSEVRAADPCPELPPTFADPGKMRKIAREIKGFTSEPPAAEGAAEDEATTEVESEPWADGGRPEQLVKSVVATTGDVYAFGPLLAAAAYERGFHAAARKAFVADGSATNWGVWRKFFSHYTPILDFVHALMYVYAAALAGRPAAEGWADYRDWAQWLWSGEVERVLAALQARQAEWGSPAPGEEHTPRAQVDASLQYLRNQRGRMDYAAYRRQGLPTTSSAIESTIKQINRRIKGSEKFWDEGADPLLHLVADRLSQTQVRDLFWSRRTARIAQSATYPQAA
jgi:hypothetical protein